MATFFLSKSPATPQMATHSRTTVHTLPKSIDGEVPRTEVAPPLAMEGGAAPAAGASCMMALPQMMEWTTRMSMLMSVATWIAMPRTAMTAPAVLLMQSLGLGAACAAVSLEQTAATCSW